MEKKTVEEKEENNIYTKVKTIETTLEDGFVHEADIHKVDPDNYGKYHKGYSKSEVFATNDPRITKPFVYAFFALFFIIGLLLLIFNNFFMGIIFIATSLFFVIKSKKDINKIEQKLKESGNYKEKLSNEEKEAYKRAVKESVNDATQATLTKKNGDWFLKTSLPIYCIICLIIFLVISIFIDLFFGIFILVLLIMCGLFYFWIIKKLFKY